MRIKTDYKFKLRPLSYEIVSNGYQIYLENQLFISHLDDDSKPISDKLSFKENCLKELEILQKCKKPFDLVYRMEQIKEQIANSDIGESGEIHDKFEEELIQLRQLMIDVNDKIVYPYLYIDEDTQLVKLAASRAVPEDVIVDPTLTGRGDAADAEVVGIELKKLRQEIDLLKSEIDALKQVES